MGLLEREAELAAIGAAVRRAHAGDGSVLALAGAPGIGKSALLAAAVAAADGLQVVQARAAPLEQSYAFGVVRTLFAPIRGSAAWPALTADAARLALPALDPSASFAGPGEEARHAALHGLTWLVANLAAQAPVLIAVDDVHWADAPSLRWLAHLARRVAGLRVLVLVAVRSGEPPSDPALLGALLESATAVRPRPLSPASTAALVRARVPSADDGVCAACHEATGGNPFLVDALATALSEAASEPSHARIAAFGPEAVARDVAQRLQRLGPDPGRVALAAAILGPGAPPRLVSALAGVSRERAAEAADALRAAAVLAPGARLELAHPILATAVLAQLGPGRTAIWHRRAWQLLHAGGAEPERQALHLLHVDPDGDARVVATLRSAARAAVARGAPDTAAVYLRRALDEPPAPEDRPWVLLECGLALAAHRDREAPARLREAITLIAPPGLRAQAALRAAQALALAALYDDMISICHLALADTGDAAPEVVARLEAELVGLGLTRAEALADCRARVQRARQSPPEVELWRVNAAGLDTFSGVPAQVPLAQLRRPELEREGDSLVGTVVRGLMLIYNDDLERALEHCQGLLEAARPRGWASAVANVNWLRAMAALRLGRVGEALEDARPAYEFKVEVGAPPDSLAWATAPLADALLEHGEAVAAEAVLTRWDADALAPGVLTRPILLESRARLRLAQQRPREALRDARAAATEWALRDADGPGVVGWRLCAVEALVALGRHAEAAVLAADQLACAERHGTATALAAAHRAVALTCTRPDDALTALRLAVSAAGASEPAEPAARGGDSPMAAARGRDPRPDGASHGGELRTAAARGRGPRADA
ncbi:ATP-binding protein, partial [Solirubrobacter deserti]